MKSEMDDFELSWGHIRLITLMYVFENKTPFISEMDLTHN